MIGNGLAGEIGLVKKESGLLLQPSATLRATLPSMKYLH